MEQIVVQGLFREKLPIVITNTGGTAEWDGLTERKLSELTDEELVRRSQAEQDSATCWEELFARHRRKVALWCYRYAGDRETAADLAQEVFAKVWRGQHTFAGGARFTTWLYSVCRNHCLNHVRAQSSRPEGEQLELVLDIADTSQVGREDAIDQARRRDLALEWMRSRLDETERRVMVLHYGQEVPLDVVTRMLGLTNASGAKAFVVSARRKLETAVRKWKAAAEETRGGGA